MKTAPARALDPTHPQQVSQSHGFFKIRVFPSHVLARQTPETASSLSGGEPAEGNLMFVKHHFGSLVAATRLMLAAWGRGGGANAADPFALTSPTLTGARLRPANGRCGS